MFGDDAIDGLIDLAYSDNKVYEHDIQEIITKYKQELLAIQNLHPYLYVYCKLPDSTQGYCLDLCDFSSVVTH